MISCAGAIADFSVSLRNSASLCVLSRLRQRVAVPAVRRCHGGRRALAAYIHAPRGVLGVPVGACGMFCQLQESHICAREAGRACGWCRRDGCGEYAPYRGVVVVRLECLEPTWEGGVQSGLKSIIIVLQYCKIAVE